MKRADRPMRLPFLLLLGLAALELGCGYALVGRGSNIPEDVREVFLEPLTNQTQRSQVEQFLTQAIADELVTRQRFRLVSGRTEADAELSGSVIAFAVNPVTFDPQGRATEYEIIITAKMLFRRTGGGSDEDGGGGEATAAGEEAKAEVLWRNDRYLFRDSYEIEVSEAGYFDPEDQAIREVAGRFAETMVTDLLEGF